ncbi:MAG: hypothetical protein IJX91_00320 [Clostridia bacterium]|nr:hypothetical protein [Clostridia bacterium]
MSKKHTLKKVAALILALGMTIGAAGCNFLVTDSMKDLEQVVATVDISDTLGSDDDYKEYKDDIEKLIEKGGLSTDIPKRDLVAYFLNVGYTYVQSYGYTYEDTFNMLMDGLTENKILTQYAVAYFLKKGGKTADDCLSWVTAEQEKYKNESTVYNLLKAHPEVLTMQYFLTGYGGNTAEDMKPYWEALYNLKKSLNSSLDSAETSYIKTSEHTHSHDETRTTPTNVNTEKEDYVPMKDGKLDYDVYTGRNATADCGAYEKQDGSTATTRKKAYNSFLSNLQSYGLIQDGENVANVTELDYYYIELSSTLGQALVNKCYEEMKDDAIALMTTQDVLRKYNEIFGAQKEIYDEDYTAFDTALDSLSDTSFALYGLQDFGFVYNILLPFSAEQEEAYNAAKNKGLTTSGQYNARKAILEDIVAEDLRGAWFCEEEDENYSYEATEYYGSTGTAGYLFFDNNLNNDEQYEGLTQYAGLYPYQGKVTYKNGTFEKATPNKTMKIGDFIKEFESYINYVVDDENVKAAEVKDWNKDGENTLYDYNKTNYDANNDGEVDSYGDFVKYVGKVSNLDADPANYFNKESNAYKALSAVNELMFAYSTDTGCLNTYMGYAVSPYGTDFVSEFEWAAQYVVREGVGTYAVAPSDYGWHIIYCSYKFSGGEVYGLNEETYLAQKDTVGTFSNLFYESLKSSSATSHADAMQSSVLNKYKASVELFTDRYQDLLDLDNA